MKASRTRIAPTRTCKPSSLPLTPACSSHHGGFRGRHQHLAKTVTYKSLWSVGWVFATFRKHRVCSALWSIYRLRALLTDFLSSWRLELEALPHVVTHRQVLALDPLCTATTQRPGETHSHDGMLPCFTAGGERWYVPHNPIYILKFQWTPSYSWLISLFFT